MNILEKILVNKKKEVENDKVIYPIEEIKKKNI